MFLLVDKVCSDSGVSISRLCSFSYYLFYSGTNISRIDAAGLREKCLSFLLEGLKVSSYTSVHNKPFVFLINLVERFYSFLPSLLYRPVHA